MFTCTAVGDPLPTISWYISGADASLSNITPFDDEGSSSGSGSGFGSGSISRSSTSLDSGANTRFGSGIDSTSSSGFSSGYSSGFSSGSGSAFEKNNNAFIIHTTRVLNKLTVMSSLRLSKTAPYLAEDYVCVASNIIGNDSRTATIVVHGKFSLLLLVWCMLH